MTAPWGDLGKPGHVNEDSEWEALLDLIGGPPRARLRQTSAQLVANSTFTTITFDVEDYDNYDGHSITLNTGRYTAQIAGYYHICGKIAWVANATGRRASVIQVNGVDLTGSQIALPATAANDGQFPILSTDVLLSVNDYVQVQGFQESGGNLNTGVTGNQGSMMTVRWVGLP